MTTDQTTIPAIPEPQSLVMTPQVAAHPVQPDAPSVQPAVDDNGGNAPTSPSQNTWRWFHTLGLLIILVAIGLICGTQRPHIAFLLSLMLFGISATIIGQGVKGLWRGMLIDERNRISLSRLQMTLWTIIVLSGFSVAVFWNISRKADAPLAIAVPLQLWLLMGISVTSLVGSPLILSPKKKETDDTGLPALAVAKKEEKERTINALVRQGVARETITVQGLIVGFRRPEDSRLANLFQGEEAGNAATVDLGKIQMYYFTIILVFTYIVMVVYKFSQVSSTSEIHALPGLDNSLIALLGISHAGYLANKAVPHSVSQ